MDLYKDLPLTERELIHFTSIIKDRAHEQGIMFRNQDQPSLLSHIPITLFPSPFPNYLYDEAMLVQKDFQTLAHLASLDETFIIDSLKSVILHDEFTKKLFDIYMEVKKGGFKPKFYFNITRSDYMLRKCDSDEDRPFGIKQIEINMISVGLSGQGEKLSKMYRFLADCMDKKSPFKKENIPVLETIDKLGAGFAKCWQLYNSEDALVVFVAEENDCSRIDQRLHEYAFQNNLIKFGVNKYVPVLYLSLQDIHRNGVLGEDNRFFIEGKEVAMFYFRTGYSPDSYTSDAWDARILIEKSVAVKCPTVAEQLIGTKKVQQIFALPGMVEKFINNGEAVKRIRRTFAGLYTLDPGPEGDASAKMALEDPGNYVLKPQREGGGNNMYDDDLVNELKCVTDPAERSQYILMERVRPPSIRNYLVKANSNAPILADTITELGIVGVFLHDGDKEILNNSVGSILRSKSIEHDDGGIVAGRAFLDAPYLI